MSRTARPWISPRIPAKMPPAPPPNIPPPPVDATSHPGYPYFHSWGASSRCVSTFAGLQAREVSKPTALCGHGLHGGRGIEK